MSNMENIDQNSIHALSNYGRAMKYYAIAKLIWTVFSIILVFVLQSSMMGLLTLTEEEMMENAGSIMLLGFFVLVVGGGGGIFIIVRYFIYVFKLNKVSKSAVGNILQTIFKLEILVLITYVIAAFLMNPVIIIFVNLVTITLLIAETFYLGKWALSLSNHAIDDNKINQLLSAIRIMKIGLIVKLGVFLQLFASPSLNYAGMIISNIGNLILIVGMLKTANEILITFNMGGNSQTEYSNTLRNRGPVQRPPVQNPQIENWQHSTQPDTSTVKSPGPKDMCPYCGSPISDPNTKFCSVCGEKIE